MRSRNSWLIGTALAVTCCAGAALAGPCTGQIAQLQQQVGTAPAGGGTSTSSPTATGTTSGSAASQTPPGISAAKGITAAPGSTLSADQARQNQAAASSTSGANPAAQPGGAATAKEGSPGISAMKGATAAPANAPGANQPAGTVTGNLATSAQDVRAQQQGLPTAAEATKQGSQAGAARNPQILVALNNARQFDLQGKEADCMKALDEARALMK